METDIDETEDGEAASADASAGRPAQTPVCLSCGATSLGPFCVNCGQKNDDLRRSSFLLARDFFRDTFGFDSRMWRTLGLMAVAPGLVPSDYSHGRRSRYSPPVRLFLVVSFLFFLTLAMTQTLFIAVEVTKKTPEEIVAERAAFEERVRRAGSAAPEMQDELVVIDGQRLDCGIKFRTRFFVRTRDVEVDESAWRACAESMKAASIANVVEAGGEEAAEGESMRQVLGVFDRVVNGLTRAVENPRAFNNEVNAWLPRVMFLMTPVLALLMALFIRGPGALLFDHLVLSLYSHAVGFAVVGTGIVAAQLGARYAAAVSAGLVAVYFLLAMKRAYGRGWVKTVISSLFIAFLYMTILSVAVMMIVSNAVLAGG